MALGLFVSVWVTGPIRKLTGYARSVSEGRRAALPELGGSEIGDLGRAFDQMREALEGKKYVERYVEALTHEVKGPLSGIRGAAELLAEGVPADARGRFTANILKETGRIERIVDRLLLLSALESRHGLRDVEVVDLGEVAADLADALAPVIESRDLSLRNEVEGPAEIRGERFLVRQAVANLLQNAVEFSPAGREIALRLERGEGWAEIVVEDSGPGVPDYARERVFERFYSLQRPDTGAKSSGLGLSFVREAALLHGGSARLEDRPGGGTRAVLRLATGPPQS